MSAKCPGRLQRSIGRLGLRRLGSGAGVLLVVLALAVLMFGQYGWRVIAYPYPLDYGEGPLLDQALRLAGGENIYRADFTAPPWTVANYPPLFMLLQAPLTLIWGPAYWYGRLIAWLSTVAAAVLVGLIVHRLTRDRLAALISAPLLVAIPYVSFWSPLVRIDTLALALSLAGLYVVVRWPDRNRALLAGVLLLTAAVYTRQSYGLAAPLAAFTWLLWERPRRALGLALGMAALGLGLFALLNWSTGGGFWLNIVVANVNQYRLAALRQYAVELWQLMPVLVAGSVVFVLLAGWRGVRSWRLIAPYWIGAALSALTIGKIGSNVNYLLELSAAMSMAIGALIAVLRRRPVLQQIALLVLAMQVLLLIPPSRYHLFTLSALDDRAPAEELLATVRAAHGPVLADEAMGLLPLVGRRIQLQPFEMTQMARAGVWDETPLLDAIAQRQYARILIWRIPGFPLERERWTDAMLRQIERSYRRRATIGSTTVYEPRPR